MSKRLSLIISDDEAQTIAPFTEPGTPAHDALRHFARVPADRMSEAAMLRALILAGAEALTERALDAGYAELAETYNADGPASERRAARARYIDRTESRA